MLSALDLAHYYNKKPEIIEEIKERLKNKIFFLDSGGFEKFNIPHFEENWEVHDLIMIIEKVQPNLIVAFDVISNFYKKKELSLFRKTLQLADGIINVEKKFEVIIHSFNLGEIFQCLQKLKEYDTYIYAIGIPERNLGNSIKVRYSKIKQISNYIKNSLKWHGIHLHLFGCSDPSNMIEYSKIGIEIFDGVHWQDLIIDPLNKSFLSFSNLLKLKCECSYCLEFKKKINENYEYEENYYNFYAINHNLEIYKNLWG